MLGNGKTFKRPVPEESIEDLIEQDREFRKLNLFPDSSCKPAATAVRITDEKIVQPTSDISSVKAKSEKKYQQRLDGNELPVGFKITPSGNIFSGFIVEKNVDNLNPIFMRNENSVGLRLTERKSKFKGAKEYASQVHSSRDNDGSSQEIRSDLLKKIQRNYDLFDPFKTSAKLPSSGTSPSRSIAFDDNDTDFGAKLHPMLDGFTESDVFEARENLLAKIKPETLEILEKRRLGGGLRKHELGINDSEKNGGGNASLTKGDISKDVLRTDDEESGSTSDEICDLPIPPASVTSIPHMQTVETEKLEWTKTVKTAGEISAEDSLKKVDRSARFTFDGRLMTKDLESNLATWDRALHHHGEEMERPGYTIEELFMMARSRFPQQRSLGLGVLGEIFRSAHNGDFDMVLDPSIFNICNEMDFIHVLRVAADGRDSLSLNASLKCIAALIHPEHEEVGLDVTINWPNSTPFPWLALESTSMKTVNLNSTDEEIDEMDLKDFQYVKLDLIEFLITRANIIARFDYILKNTKNLLNESGVEDLLKALIRLARHSPNKITDCPSILAHVQQNFITPNWTNEGQRLSNLVGIPLPEALKLFRILASSSLQNSRTLYEKYSPFKAIMTYLSFDQWTNQTKVKKVENLIMESFLTWEAFLKHNFGIAEFMSFIPVIMEFYVRLYGANAFSSFDLIHLARLNSLVSSVVKFITKVHNTGGEYTNLKDCVVFVSLLVNKLIVCSKSVDMEQDLLKEELFQLAISKGLECLKLARQFDPISVKKVDILLEKELAINGLSIYQQATKRLRSHSLLCFNGNNPPSEKEKSKFPVNMFPSSAILFGGFQNPILKAGSPFAFVTSLWRYFSDPSISTDNLNNLNNSEIRNYLKELSGLHVSVSSRPNIFLRFELYCIRELIQTSDALQRSNFAYQFTSCVHHGDENLAKSFLTFSLPVKVYGSEVVKLYTNLLHCQIVDDPHDFKRINKQLVSGEWILQPLNYTHSEIFSSATKFGSFNTAGNVIKMLLDVLSAISIRLNIFGYRQQINNFDVASFYTSVCRVFLMGSEVFLDKDIRSKLRDLLPYVIEQILISKGTGIFANSNSWSLQSFTTFYGELLEAFAADSFGDDVFGAYLLIPVQSASHREIKSLFWNEQAIQFLRTKLDDSLVPLSYFGVGEDPDEHMLSIYRNIISSERVRPTINPLLYAIASNYIGNLWKPEV